MKKENKGRVWGVEAREYTDPMSGIPITQLTDYRGNSWLPYFTEPNWYDGNRKFLFNADRENCSNLYSMNLDTYEITQLTDFGPEFNGGAIRTSPDGETGYIWHGKEYVAVNLQTLEETVVYRVENDMAPGMVCMGGSLTADGKNMIVTYSEDLSGRFRIDNAHGYVGFFEQWEAKPRTKIVRLELATGKKTVIYEENAWITHMNTSHARPDLMTFCHEGPWKRVDQRMWTLNIETGKFWALRPRKNSIEAFGHEFWLADGETIGYHGWDNEAYFFGKVKYDNTEAEEFRFPLEIGNIGHVQFNNMEMAVADGSQKQIVRVWKRKPDGTMDGPRLLCEHRSSENNQYAHVHPRFSPDNSAVLFSSDTSAYINIYVARLPEKFESLPAMPEGGWKKVNVSDL